MFDAVENICKEPSVAAAKREEALLVLLKRINSLQEGADVYLEKLQHLCIQLSKETPLAANIVIELYIQKGLCVHNDVKFIYMRIYDIKLHYIKKC